MAAKFQKKFWSHVGFQRYFRNTSWLFIEKVIRLTLGLFVGVWVARYLGPEKFGIFSYAQSLVGIFTAFASLGLDEVVVKEILRKEHNEKELIVTAFWLKLVGALVVITILAMSLNIFSSDEAANKLVFIIASSLVFQSFNIIDLYFQSAVLSRYVVYANIITITLISALKITLMLTGATLVAFAWVVVLDSLMLSMGLIYYFTKHTELKILDKCFKIDIAKKLLESSWPLVLSGVIVSLYMRLDQVMIKELINSEAVGNYAAAVRISEAWYFIPMVLSTSLFPAILNAKAKCSKLYYSRLQKLYDLMVWIAIAIAIPVTFFSEEIVSLLYGEKYSLASNVLTIHVWSAIFVFLGVAGGKWLIAENLQKLSLLRTLSGMLLNVALNLLLIPRYGIEGAAFATLISQFVAAYCFDIFYKKTRKMFFMKSKSFLLTSLFNKENF